MRMTKTSDKDNFFIPLAEVSNSYKIPEAFALNDTPHPLAVHAAYDLQEYLKTQTDWHHNFGLSQGQPGAVIGKMFGVLVVKSTADEIGYLAAFSGKLAGGNQHTKFVPPVFDGLTDQSFVNEGMRALTRINLDIKSLEDSRPAGYEEQVKLLKSTRRAHSNSLQHQIFDNYFFLNRSGEKKSLAQIFKKAQYKNPPSGAGECAGPKLLQYAFLHQMKPITLTEFWWGLSPKSDHWKHGQFYPCCKEKCEPIFNHMLDGLV
jgi:tRNA pseudouridine32 synthase/23S rRNA pseudouridine746 synthase